MTEKIEDFIVHQGPMDSPMQHAKYCVFAGRQQGKTFALVEALPDDKCMVVVHSINSRDNIKSLIRQHRKDYDISNISFVSTKNKDWEYQLKGFSFPVFVDNGVLDNLVLDFVDGLNIYANSREQHGY